jgi:Flp pilus assembly pilin Flp
MLNKARKQTTVTQGKRLKSFGRNTSGTTAIEFALLGIPFAALLFGIIELAMVFFIGSTSEHAMAEVAREIRTGEFQTSGGTRDSLHTAICAQMHGIGNCDNLRVDVISANTGKFTDLNVPPPLPSPPPCTGTPSQIKTCEGTPPAVPGNTYDTTGGGDVVIVRVQYFHPLAVPSALTGLANARGNVRVITSTTAFRNEPFGGTAFAGGGG